MMKTFSTILGSGIAAVSLAFAGPALAQDESEDVVIEGAETGSDAEPDEAAEAMAALAGMFQVDPLTVEQEARLPIAQSVVDKMMPPGSLQEVMGSMYDEMLGPIMSMATQTSAADVAGPLGLQAYELDLDQEQLEQAVSIIDPVREERVARSGGVMPAIMQEMMAAMEPSMRTAMAEAYTVHFNDQELADIDVFFSTESGLSFARKSLTMSSDPRIVSASLKAMPEMMASLENLEPRIEEATADLPEVRGFDDLTEAQQAELSALVGFSVDELSERAASMAE